MTEKYVDNYFTALSPRQSNIFAASVTERSRRFRLPDDWRGSWIEVEVDVPTFFALGDYSMRLVANQHSEGHGDTFDYSSHTGFPLVPGIAFPFLVTEHQSHFAFIAARRSGNIAVRKRTHGAVLRNPSTPLPDEDPLPWTGFEEYFVDAWDMEFGTSQVGNRLSNWDGVINGSKLFPQPFTTVGPVVRQSTGPHGPRNESFWAASNQENLSSAPGDVQLPVWEHIAMFACKFLPNPPGVTSNVVGRTSGTPIGREALLRFTPPSTLAAQVAGVEASMSHSPNHDVVVDYRVGHNFLDIRENAVVGRRVSLPSLGGQILRFGVKNELGVETLSGVLYSMLLMKANTPDYVRDIVADRMVVRHVGDI